MRLYGHRETEGYRLEVAGYYIDDAWYACDDLCNSEEYLDALIFWNMNYNTWDICYPEFEDPDMWSVWPTGGGYAGNDSDWTCSCGNFFFAGTCEW